MTRALAGLKGYTTNLTDASAEFVIDAYHELWHVEEFPHVKARFTGPTDLPPHANPSTPT